LKGGIKMAEKVMARRGGWAILRYSGNGKFTYWVVSLPDRKTTLQFPNLQKARQYFNKVQR
jgi:hypothetical protein